MSQENDLHTKEPLGEDSVSSLSHGQSSNVVGSATATSKPQSRADKFSHHIKQYPNEELKVYSEGKSLIGSGGFGNVRKYHHKGKIVAVKEFTIAGNDEAVNKIWNMVLHEANILCRFQHENIVEILGATQWPNIVGIIMEYIDGGNLQSLLSEDNQSQLLWNTRLKIARGITSGLDYIHNYGEKKTFCHGDLKPANVLLTSDLQVKLADFGSAAFHRATASSTTTMTKVSTTQFTLIYVAPEFLVDNTQKRSPAMDMYSFGLLLYELLCGKAPYSDSTMPMHVPALIMAKIKPSAKLIDNAESQLQTDDDRAAFNLLKKLMQRCWNSDPASRPSSKTVKMELSSYVMDQTQGSSLDSSKSNPPVSSPPNPEMQKVSVDTAGNERENVTASSATALTKQDESVSALTSSLLSSLFGNDQPGTSSDFTSPKQPFDEEVALKKFLGGFGSSRLFGNATPDQDYLEKYTDALLNQNYEEADISRIALRSFIVDEVRPEAEDVRQFAERLRIGEKYLQSIAVYDSAAALFANMKDPEDDIEKIQMCIQGMKVSNERMVQEDSNMKVIVRDHVLPIMHYWLREMKTTTQVSEKWKCHTVSWSLSHIENCELLADQLQERRRSLEEAVSGMRRVFGAEVHKLHGRLFGTLLNNLGTAYRRESRLEEAVILFKEAVEAEKAALDYFGDDDTRREHLEISERNLKSCRREAWEYQLKKK